MCLSAVFKKGPEENIFLCKNIARVLLKDGKIVCYDLMGQRTVFAGEILDIDLMENIILIKEAGE